MASEQPDYIHRLTENDPTLTKLILDGNSIGDEGAKAIARALETNTVLTELFLSYNSIGDEGAKAIAQALETNTTLTTLWLSNNSIGVEGAKACLYALEFNSTITDISGLSNKEVDQMLSENKSGKCHEIVKANKMQKETEREFVAEDAKKQKEENEAWEQCEQLLAEEKAMEEAKRKQKEENKERE
jgi:hypothetical protein